MARFEDIEDAGLRIKYDDAGFPVDVLDARGNSFGFALINKTLTGRIKTLFPISPSDSGSLYGQPPQITSFVKKEGKLVCNFTAGQWMVNGGTVTFNDGVSNYAADGSTTGIPSRTGQPSMAQCIATAATAAEIRLITPATGLRTKTLAGKLRLWVHLATLPGYEAGVGNNTGKITLTLTTEAAGSNANALVVTFSANQLREGWNALDFIMRNPNAYKVGQPDVEYHPFGIQVGVNGTGVDSDILNNPISKIIIGFDTMLGATLHFDSIWTDFSSTCQVVLGCDSTTQSLTDVAIPKFKEYGWTGYLATPMRVWTSGDKTVSDAGTISVHASNAKAAGWEIINHTVNHLNMATLTAPGEIAYEMLQSRAWYLANGMPWGAEFYASPQSGTSRLSEKIIKDLGFKVQRHGKKWNVTQTGFGIDNPHHIGSIDLGAATGYGISKITGGVGGSDAGAQTFTKIKRQLETAEAYGCAVFPFWHGMTTLGDSGSGDDLTGDNLLITNSAWLMTMAHIRSREQAGGLVVSGGFNAFYYGV